MGWIGWIGWIRWIGQVEWIGWIGCIECMFLYFHYLATQHISLINQQNSTRMHNSIQLSDFLLNKDNNSSTVDCTLQYQRLETLSRVIVYLKKSSTSIYLLHHIETQENYGLQYPQMKENFKIPPIFGSELIFKFNNKNHLIFAFQSTYNAIKLYFIWFTT